MLSTAPGVAVARHKKQCVEALLALYQSWNEADPGKGYDAKAAE